MPWNYFDPYDRARILDAPLVGGIALVVDTTQWMQSGTRLSGYYVVREASHEMVKVLSDWIELVHPAPARVPKEFADMCGRYSMGVSVDADALANRFGWSETCIELTPRYNIAPTQEVLAVVSAGDGNRRAGLLRWGLVPYWSESLRIGSTMINAKAETLTTRPAFREALKKRRCLVMADGFYEWKADMDGGKTPMYFRLKSHEPFAFAGLWAA